MRDDIVITESEVADQLLRLTKKKDDPGLAMWEIAKLLNKPIRTCNDLIRRSVRAGEIRVVRGVRYIEDLMGRTQPQPVYRILPVEKPAKKTKKKSKK